MIELTASLPLFPLGTVLFPGVVLPLHIFEERYRGMILDLLAAPETSRSFGVIGIREGREVGIGAASQLHTIGCAAELRRVEALPDGRFHVLAIGRRRFRLISLDTGRDLVRADVALLDEPTGDGAAMAARRTAAAFLGYYRALLAAQGIDEVDQPELPSDPTALSYALADAVLVDDDEKQRLLEAPSTADRLAAELVLLQRETALIGGLGLRPAVELQHPGYSDN
jgi:Lon protease-like protein